MTDHSISDGPQSEIADARPVQPHRADIEQLARAVVRAGGNAVIIHEDNSSGGWVSIDQAVASGHAFAVEPKRDLIALDLDTPELIELGEQAARLAEDSGCPVLWVASGRNRHLYVNAGRHRSIVEEHLRGIIPATAFRTDTAIRPPLAPHRLGRATALIGPETVAEALAVLGEPEQPRPLEPWAQHLLRCGGWVNRSNMAIALASAFKRAGLSYDDYRRAMLDPRNAGGEKAQELAETGKDPGFLLRTWEKAGGFLTEQETLNRLAGIRDAVVSAEWPGRTGSTDRKVMLAVLDYAETVPTLAPEPGIRKLTELAQIGDKKTPRNALSRIAGSGWLSIKVKDQARWALVLPKVTESPHSTTGGNGRSMGLNGYFHPAFRAGGGLGDIPGRVWYRLCEAGPLSPAKLRQSIGSTSKTIHKALKRLAAFGLVEKVSHGVYAALGTEVDLDRVATELGVYDRMERQVKSHQADRDRWDWERTRWACPVMFDTGDVCGEWKHRDQADCGRHSAEFEPLDVDYRERDDALLREQLGVIG